MENDSPKFNCEKILKNYDMCIKEISTDPNIISKTGECIELLKKYTNVCEKK